LGQDNIQISVPINVGKGRAASDHGFEYIPPTLLRRYNLKCGGVVLAVEAAEGTDAMLIRCAHLPQGLRATPGERRRGVLVKLPKPGQERRIDMPAIGGTTLRLAAAAGLAGIAFEAGGALLVDVTAMISEADALGMFLIGLNGAEENR